MEVIKVTASTSTSPEWKMDLDIQEFIEVKALLLIICTIRNVFAKLKSSKYLVNENIIMVVDILLVLGFVFSGLFLYVGSIIYTFIEFGLKFFMKLVGNVYKNKSGILISSRKYDCSMYLHKS